MIDAKEDSVSRLLARRPQELAERAILELRTLVQAGDWTLLPTLDHLAALARWQPPVRKKSEGAVGMRARREWAATFVRIGLAMKRRQIEVGRSHDAVATAARSLPLPAKTQADFRAWRDWAWSYWWADTCTGDAGAAWEREEKEGSVSYWRRRYGVDTREDYLRQRAPWLVEGLKHGEREYLTTALRDALMVAMKSPLRRASAPKKSKKNRGQSKRRAR